jgi:hypothetical protein
MKRLLIILPILSLLVTACYQEPYADAYISPNPAWVGEDITFTNLSHNTDYSEWTMGDGSSSSSFNVIHFYYDPGYYDVTLRSYGRKGGINVASFEVEVVGSELKVIVKEFVEEYFIEGAEVTLFYDYDAWKDWNFDRATETQISNRYGECYFSNLSYQKYYVDVYYRVGNEGYSNELLGFEDPTRWIETPALYGAYDPHIFFAYAEAVYFEGLKKSADKTAISSGGRPAERHELKRQQEINPADMPVRENSISPERGRK